MDFQILPHVLRAYQPPVEHCLSLPWIDFSWTFPVPWIPTFTDISVPSHHMQDGKRYDAEVVISHVYAHNKETRLVRIKFSLEREHAYND